MSDLPDRLARVVTGQSRVVIVALLVVSVLFGAGAADGIEQSSSLEQFETDSTAAAKLDYIQENFTRGDDNTTTVQLIVRGDNVLSKSSLVRSLELQQELRNDGTVGPTLAEERSTVGIANLIAITSIRTEEAAELRAEGAALEAESTRLNRTAESLTMALNETRALQQEYDQLNASYQRGEIDRATYRERAGAIEDEMAAVEQHATRNLTRSQVRTFRQAAAEVRATQHAIFEASVAHQRGELSDAEYQDRLDGLQSRMTQAYRLGTEGVLEPEYAALQERAEALAEERAALQNASAPTLDRQIREIRSMNASELNATIETVLGPDGGAHGFMATDYEPGSSTASATMILVTQTTERAQSVSGEASERLVESQTRMQVLAGDVRGDEVLVFGAGIISDEIERSMTDSLSIVGPFAILFVILTLVVAYRDPLDILLGLFGIGLVLVWTFGFMGWLGLTFNQILIAVPVLLIGLGIDYAIHIFMRHREERTEHHDDTRRAMRVALGSVGVALVWVTATTVIGFLSNLVSPLGPIRDFGVLSSFGIFSALIVFGALVPAMKVELDSLLEGWGLDRKLGAFGTGGGVLSGALSVGATAAKRAPAVVIALALLVSAAGAIGATQVDTTFAQEDFLAEEPPAWMDGLPEGMAPGEYTAKANLDYVNERFVRDDSQAQFLVENDVTSPRTLDRLDAGQDAARKQSTTVVLSNGEADLESPLTLMADVARENETFNATLQAADTDGDGVPDRKVVEVYDALFAAAPDRAAGVIHRTDDGEYAALRMTVATKGGADSGTVTEEMREVADGINAPGILVTATGQTVVFEIIQDELLETVIQSLLITLVAVFLFLMATYRITDGSATLGAVTLLPVAISVTWILGSMYALGMPFNVLTGMITSLTIGLGVAYSIHLSERYNHELDRYGSISEALDASVIGTGGALLGSAATTVGGFGVLVFAIFPALQQFGIITGLTIIYAFLASVLVLPSLLVVWTKYLGPDVPMSPAGEDPDAPGARPHAPGDGPGPSPHAASSPPDLDTLLGAAGVDDGGLADAQATRVVQPDYAAPGQPVSLTIASTPLAGRVLCRQQVPAGAEVSLESVHPDPVDVVHVEEAVFVLWDGERPAGHTVELEITLPPEVVDGTEVPLETWLGASEGAIDVAGPAAVTVVTDILERLGTTDSIDADDLALAGEYVAQGRLSVADLERLYREWLGTGEDDLIDREPDVSERTGDREPTEHGEQSGDATGGHPSSSTSSQRDED